MTKYNMNEVVVMGPELAMGCLAALMTVYATGTDDCLKIAHELMDKMGISEENRQSILWVAEARRKSLGQH
jgi:hypothetical protein